MELRPACLALIGSVLVACGTSVEPEQEAPEIITGTVVETTEGAKLCEGPVAESAPPQCDGPHLESWEWSQVWSGHGTQGGRWGEFCFLGERDGSSTIQVMGSPRPAGTCDLPEVTGHVSVIEQRDGETYICLGPYEVFAPHSCPEGSSGAQDRRLPIADWTWPEDADIYEAGGARQADLLVHGVLVDDTFVLTRPPEPTDPSDAPPSSPYPCGEVLEHLPEDPEASQDVVVAAAAHVRELDIPTPDCDDIHWDSPLVTAAQEAGRHDEHVLDYFHDGDLIVWLRVADDALLPALQRVAGDHEVFVYAQFEPVADDS